MKPINFLRVLPKLTSQFLKGYWYSLKSAWTDKHLFWSFDQTYFSGDKEEELRVARDKFIEDYKKLIN